jgi:transposase
MQIIGCDLHARQQTLAMLGTATGEVLNKTLTHEGESVREFYSTLPSPVRVGIEATGSMKWFVQLMEELGIDCQVGHPATIRAAEPRRQKHDQRDAELLLKLLVENRFPSIWQPSKELLDLRGLLLHRHQWVRLRTRITSPAHFRSGLLTLQPFGSNCESLPNLFQNHVAGRFRQWESKVWPYKFSWSKTVRVTYG